MRARLWPLLLSLPLFVGGCPDLDSGRSDRDPGDGEAYDDPDEPTYEDGYTHGWDTALAGGTYAPRGGRQDYMEGYADGYRDGRAHLADAEDEPDLARGAGLPDDCDTDPRLEDRFYTVQGAVEDSVHELVTCGGAQVSLARSLTFVILSSNAGFFSPETRAELAEYLAYLGGSLDVPFTPDANGRWTMALAAGAGSKFSIRFFAPGEASTPLDGDVFRLEAYVRQAEVHTRLTWQEMQADWLRQNVYTFTWDHLGPLGHVLFPDGEPAERRFVVRASLAELASLVWPGVYGSPPDLGPLAALGDLGIDSRVTLIDERDGVRIRYGAAGQRGTLRGIAGDSQVGFLMDGLEASDGDVTVEGRSEGLRYADGAGLAGLVHYTLRAGDRAYEAESDFGDGASYPTVRWSCPTEVPDPLAPPRTK